MSWSAKCAMMCVLVSLSACAAREPFQPPAGATVIYSNAFEDGKTDGWSGKVTAEHGLPGSRGSLLVPRQTGGAARSMKIPLAAETVLCFDVYTEDCSALIIQARNDTGRYDCRSYCFLYSNVNYGKWTRIYWPLTRALVENNNNRKWPVAGDVLSNLAITKKTDKGVPPGQIQIDNVVIFSLDGPGKVVQAQAALKRLPNEMAAAVKAHPALTEAAKRWTAEVDRLAVQAGTLAGRKDLPYGEGAALWEEVDALVRLVDRCARYYGPAEKAFGDWPDMGVGTEHSMVRISDLHWAYPFRGEMTGRHRLWAARHQYESFQAVVMPFTKDLTGVSVAFSDLRQAGGSGVIPAAQCTWRRQPYVQLKPTFHYPGYDWLAPKPDPLLSGKPFDLPATRYAPLWITVYTPPDIPAGQYEGTMTVSAKGAKPAKVTISLRVWDYNIPLRGVFRGQTHFDLGNVRRFYKTKVTPEIRRQWYAFILKYRFSPTAQYAGGLHPVPEDLEFCKERGCNLWLFGNGDFRSGIKEDRIRRQLAQARQAGVLDDTLAYIGDEPGPKRFKQMADLANQVHAKFPGLKVMIGGSRPRKELVGYVDVWDPIMNFGGTYGFDPAEIAAAYQRGEQVMWYTAASPWHPYPNVQMGDPLYASRIIFWLTWKYRITGFEYYYWNLWAGNMTHEPRWPKGPWDTHSFKSRFNPYNGDGMLCYPGPDGPAASVRLENIRDGIQDWETFYILATALEALRADLAAARLSGKATADLGREKVTLAELTRRSQAIVDIDEGFCKDPMHWVLDPEGLLRRRNEAGRLIETIITRIGRDRFEKFMAGKKAARRKLERRRLEANRARALKALGAEAKPKQ